MKLLELTGLPGSGKSTLMPMVRRAFLRRHLRLLTAEDLVGGYDLAEGRMLSLLHILRLPEALKRRARVHLFRARDVGAGLRDAFLRDEPDLAEIVRQAADRHDLSEAERVHKLEVVFRQFGLYQMAEKLLAAEDYFLFDEGLAHRALLWFVSSHRPVDAQAVLAYLDRLPAIEMVFHLDMEEGLAFERMVRRGLPIRFRHLPLEEVRRQMPPRRWERVRQSGLIAQLKGQEAPAILLFLKRCAEVLRIVLARLEEKGTLVVHLPNREHPLTTEAELNRYLKAVLP
jgi:hypothetical protein